MPYISPLNFSGQTTDLSKSRYFQDPSDVRGSNQNRYTQSFDKRGGQSSRFQQNHSQDQLNNNSRVNFAQDDQQKKFNQSRILKEQIRQNELSNRGSLQKNRIQDKKNLQVFKERYPFGHQNVKITDDIIDVYNRRYLKQQQDKDTLKRFQEQAKSFKKLQNSSKRNNVTRKTILNKVQNNDSGDDNSMAADDQNYQTTRKKRKNDLKKDELKKNLRKINAQLSYQRMQREKDAYKLHTIQQTLKEMKMDLRTHNLTTDQNLLDIRYKMRGQRIEDHRRRIDLMNSNSQHQKQRFYMNKAPTPVIVYSDKIYKDKQFFDSRSHRQVQKTNAQLSTFNQVSLPSYYFQSDLSNARPNHKIKDVIDICQQNNYLDESQTYRTPFESRILLKENVKQSNFKANKSNIYF